MDHSEFIDYLLKTSDSNKETLPALKDLSLQIGISISTLREQLAAAKILGLVDVKPGFADCEIFWQVVHYKTPAPSHRSLSNTRHQNLCHSDGFLRSEI